MGWKHRSREEQERIFKEQKAMREGKNKESKAFQRSDENAMEIYRNLENPIMCPKCFCWGSSENYTIVREPSPLGGVEMNFIKGTCRQCKIDMSRVVPVPFSDEWFSFIQILSILKNNGRVKDLRKDAS